MRYNDYQVNVTISGQTFLENDPDKQQINDLENALKRI